MSSAVHAHSMTYGLPRGRAASLKQVLRQRTVTAWQRVWSALEASGRRRAAPVLLEQADRLQSTHPELADALRRVARHPVSLTPAATTTVPAAR